MKSLLRSSEEFAQRVTKGVKTFVNFFFLKNDLRWNKKQLQIQVCNYNIKQELNNGLIREYNIV